MDIPVTITKLSAPWGALARGASKVWANPLARRTTIGAAGGAGVGGVGNALFGSRESGDVAQRFGKGMLAGGTLGAAGGAGYNFFKGAPTAKAFSGRTAARGKLRFKPTQTAIKPGTPTTTPVAALSPAPAAAPYKRPGAKNSIRNMFSRKRPAPSSALSHGGVDNVLDIAPMNAFPKAPTGLRPAHELTRQGGRLRMNKVHGPSAKPGQRIPNINRSTPVAAKPRITGRGSTMGSDLDAYPI